MYLINFFKIGIKILIFTLSSIIGLVIVLFFKIPGKSDSYINNKGKLYINSISEKTIVKFENNKQDLIIKSKNINNPIMLIVYGGMAFPKIN